MAAKRRRPQNETAKPAPFSLPDLVAMLYESACDPAGLGHFAQAAGAYFAARQCALAIWNEDNPAAFLPVVWGMSSDELQRMYEQRDQQGSIFARLGKLDPGETIVATDDKRQFLAGLAVADGKNSCAILLARDVHDSDFDAPEQEALTNLLSYCQRAVALNKRFIDLFVERRAAIAALDFAPRGIIFLTGRGRIAYCNATARMILQKCDGLSEKCGSMYIDDDKARTSFDTYIKANASSDAPTGADRMICKIPRGSAAAAYQLIVSNVPSNARQASFNEDELAFMAVVHNPDDLMDLNARYLRTFYELSPAEARLAQALYKHDSLARAAATLGITVNTARSQLKHIFKKVGVNSQSALLLEFAKALKES